LEKLTKDNFLLWKTQVLPDIRGAQLFGLLDGSMPKPEKELKETDKDGKEVKIPNPGYAQWIAADQTVLSYLVRNMSRDVLTQMVGLTSAASVWKTVMEMFASQSKVHVVQLLTQLNKCIK
jgi:rubrerythrin